MQYARSAGKAANADDAAKLDGLAPEAYIQPQDNLLDNGYFEINQQNKAEYTGATYTIDRWQMSIAHGKLNVNDGYVTLTNTSETGAQYFRQPFEILFQEGDVLTLAVMLRGSGQGQLFLGDSATGANIGGGLSFTPTDSWKVYIKTIKIGSIIPKYFTLACVGQNARFDIKCAKTEYGPYFTGWLVWNYALELARCQRYQIEIFDKKITGQSYLAQVKANGSTLAYGAIPIPVSMRDGVLPVIKTDCSADNPYLAFGVCSSGYNSRIEITEISVYSKMNNGVVLRAKGSDFIQGNDYQIYVNNTSAHHFLLNCNL